MDDKQIRIEIQAESDKAQKDIAKLTRQINKMNKDMAKGNKSSAKSMNQTSRSIKSLTAHLAKLASIYATFRGLTTGAVITAEFEQSIQQLGIYAGVSGEELNRLKDTALGLGESTVFSASQVAGGLNQMALAGLTAQEQMSGIGDVLNLASVGMIDIAEASNIAVVAMKSWELGASDIGDITDILAKGSTISATTITELGQALKKVGTVAHAYNVSIEETVASLGVLADAGRTSAEAGTQLKIVMSRLAGNKEAKKYLDELGISMYDVTTKQILPFTEQLRIVKERLKDLTPQARAVRLSEIFGEEAKASVVALIVGLDEIESKLIKIREAMADNFAEESAKKMMDTLQGSYKALMSAIEGLVLEVGESLIPVLREGLDGLTEMIRGMDEQTVEQFATGIGVLIESLFEMFEVVTDVAGGIINFTIEHKTLAKAILGIVLVVKGFNVTLSLMALALGKTGVKVGALIKLMKTLAIVMATNPVGLALLAIGTAYIYFSDAQEKAEKSHKKSAISMKKEADAVDHLLKRVSTYYNAKEKAYYITEQQRTKEIGLIGDQINATEKLLDAGQRENESDQDWIARREQMKKGNILLLFSLNSLITAKDKQLLIDKKAREAWEYSRELPKEQADNVDKLTKAYNTLLTTTTKVIDKLKTKEAGLSNTLKELALEKAQIEKKYYNERLNLQDDFEDRFEKLTETYADKHRTKRQQAQVDAEKLLIKEQKAFKELYSGNLQQANKYFDQMLKMTDELVVGSISANGKVLYTQKQVDAEKLRLSQTVYYAKMQMIESEKIAELEANLAKQKMALLELQLTREKIKLQEVYFNKLTGNIKEINDNGIDMTNGKTKESFKILNELTNTVKTNISGIEADIKTHKAKVKLAKLNKDINDTKAVVDVGLNPTGAITEMRILKGKFTEVPIDVPLGAETEYFEREAEKSKKKVSSTPAKVVVKADTKTAKKDADKLVKGIGRLKPRTQKVVAETSEAYRNVRLLVDWINKRNPTVYVQADTNNVYIPVIEAINWINSQVAYIDVYTRYHKSGGGYIPQRLAEGGTFTGSGKVAGYDSTDSDKVSAMLTGGEYVIKRQAVDTYGGALLNSINQMTFQKPQGYAEGGSVGGSGSTGNLQPINLNIGGESFAVMSDSQVADALTRHLESTGGR